MKDPICNMALPLVLGIFMVPASLHSQPSSFTVAQNGKQVGTASYSYAPSPSGLHSSSLVRVNMQGLDYALSKSEDLSKLHQFRSALLSATVNGSAVTVHASPQSGKLALDISAGGHPSTGHLAIQPASILLPDFDPGALQDLLYLAAATNSRNLWAIVPKQTGQLAPIQVATYADEAGTLDGKPLAVHHLVATVDGAVTDLFSGPGNELLQAELPQKGFSLVRKGFVLTQPANPGAAPAQ